MTRLFVTVGFRYLSLDISRLGSKVPQTCCLSVTSMINSFGLSQSTKKCVQTRFYATKSDKYKPESELATLDSFTETAEKTKGSYLDLLHFYKNRDIRRRGHVEFIYVALKHMKEFGVHKDLEAYKALIDVMPKGKYVAQNVVQAEFQHFWKQQQCIIDVLEEMEINAVCPDEELEDVILNIFGRRSHAIRRYWRMMYWMPKLKNLSPWPVPDPLPDDSLELAKLAIERITSVDPTTQITVFETKEVKDSIDHTWIVSGQSGSQRELIERHDDTKPLFVEGSFRVWLKGTSVNYFILRADPDLTPQPEPDHDDITNMRIPLFTTPKTKVVSEKTVHEQEDSTIMAVCATGSSSRDSLLSWVRLLQRDIPRLGKLSILFTLKSPLGSTEPPLEIESEEQVPIVLTDVEKEKR